MVEHLKEFLEESLEKHSQKNNMIRDAFNMEEYLEEFLLKSFEKNLQESFLCKFRIKMINSLKEFRKGFPGGTGFLGITPENSKAFLPWNYLQSFSRSLPCFFFENQRGSSSFYS